MDPRRRARKLLWSYLSYAQRVQYVGRKYIEVRGSAGGRYRIRRSDPSNVLDLSLDGFPEIRNAYIAAHMVAPAFDGAMVLYVLPNFQVADEMLALKMLIETDEFEFRSLACRRPALPEELRA